MKKNKLWAKIKIHEELNKWKNVEGGIDGYGIKYVLNIIDQLDEPEVLSQLSIDNNGVHVRNLGETFEVVAVENLLVPKQELPVIPQLIADWIEENREWYKNKFLNIGYDLYNDIIEPPIYDWIIGNQEKFARAWFDAYKVEEESLFYALVKGHELSNNEFKYWSCKAYNSGHLFVGSKYPRVSCINRMTKNNWNKLGINDSNADFVKLKEAE